jgi:hypothetical protein
MSSVNVTQEGSGATRVPNLYKKLGICNNIAVKPPLSKEQPKKGPRRQTMFVPTNTEVFKNLQRSNTYKPENHRSASNLAKKIEVVTAQPARNLTPKSRFLSNWIQNKEKENQL